MARPTKKLFIKPSDLLEIGRYGLGFAKNFNELTLDELLRMLSDPSSERHFIMYEALRKGADIQELYKITNIKSWFIEQMKELVDLEEKILKYKGQLPPDDLLIKAKKDGFADKYLAQLIDVPEEKVRQNRTNVKVEEAWEPVPRERR